MKKYFRAKSKSAAASTRSKFAEALSTSAVLGLALGLAASAVAASGGISISSFRTSESSAAAGAATTATQRKSGGHPQSSQSPSSDSGATQKGANVIQAKGTFDVKVDPQGEADKSEGSTLARMSLDKKYHGDLEASAKGTMLTAGTDVKGSAGYVAIERVTGTLNGKTGSFVLQHNATLSRGTPMQNIIVVPDSGTGQLAGITGKLTVIIADGKHSYEFDYTLPAAQ
jgi:Protein of unknown function (DUF3224)